VTRFDPDELGAELDPADRAALAETAALLTAARPLPGPGFRGALRRQTLAAGAGRLVPRPPHLRRRALGLVVAGTLLVLAAAGGLAGHGPLARPAATAGR
jgi:hypothetical protein